MVSMADGRSLALENGGRIRIVSAHGAVEAGVEIERALQAGQVMIPLAVQHNRAAALAGLTRPERNDAFGWTVCRVNIEKI
jgi:predicted molibdopterin-dependent oxidoreductase YjgC